MLTLTVESDEVGGAEDGIAVVHLVEVAAPGLVEGALCVAFAHPDVQHAGEVVDPVDGFVEVHLVALSGERDALAHGGVGIHDARHTRR